MVVTSVTVTLFGVIKVVFFGYISYSCAVQLQSYKFEPSVLKIRIPLMPLCTRSPLRFSASVW